jgi:hypothetical protein
MCGNDFQTRSQPEVEGVAQTDLRAGLDEVARGHRLDRSVSANRHEGGGFDDAMSEADAASTGRAIAGEKFEVHQLKAIRKLEVASPLASGVKMRALSR